MGSSAGQFSAICLEIRSGGGDGDGWARYDDRWLEGLERYMGIYARSKIASGSQGCVAVRASIPAI